VILALKRNRLYRVINWRTSSDDPEAGRGDVAEGSLDHADIVSSEIRDGYASPWASEQMHTPVLDLDVPCELVRSTNGNAHLFIDVDVPWSAYLDLLHALANCGIIEPGYLGASEARGFTAVRLPWVPKP
jgi:hypothetical protein